MSQQAVADSVGVVSAEQGTEVPAALTGTPAEVPEGFEYVKDGTIRLHMDGGRWMLRRPKMGEFRKFRERLEQVREEQETLKLDLATSAGDLVSSLREGVAEGDEADTVDKAQDAARAAAAAQHAANRKYTLDMEETLLGWLLEVFDVLSNKPLPAVDDLAPWFADAKLPNEFLDHWRTTPLRRGAG